MSNDDGAGFGKLVNNSYEFAPGPGPACPQLTSLTITVKPSSTHKTQIVQVDGKDRNSDFE